MEKQGSPRSLSFNCVPRSQNIFKYLYCWTQWKNSQIDHLKEQNRIHTKSILSWSDSCSSFFCKLFPRLSEQAPGN